MTAFISEIDTLGGAGGEFVEIAVPEGTDVSGFSFYIHDTDGSIRAGPFGLGTAQNTVSGKDVYVLDHASANMPGIRQDDAVALVDDTGAVLQFLSFSSGGITATAGPANGLTSTDIGTQDESGSLQSDDGGQTYYKQSNTNAGTVPCYALGTLIMTPQGPRPVEALRAGDMVVTRDRGAAKVRWVRQGIEAMGEPDGPRAPILIKRGALGAACPSSRDLIVSPHHRILIGGARRLAGYAGPECFAPAKALTGLPGIRRMRGKARVTWVHFALDTHEIVSAEGCLSESLLLGPMVMNGLSGLQKRAITAIFGPAPINGIVNGPLARDCLTVQEAQQAFQELRHNSRGPTAGARVRDFPPIAQIR